MIKKGLEKSSPFFCTENLTCWRTGGKSGKRKICGKSGKLDAENMRKVSAVWKIWKICGSCTAAENLRKNPLTGKSAENLENLENLRKNWKIWNVKYI